MRGLLFVCVLCIGSVANAQQRVCDGNTCRIVPAVATAVKATVHAAVHVPAAIVNRVVVQPVQQARCVVSHRVAYRRQCRPMRLFIRVR